VCDFSPFCIGKKIIWTKFVSGLFFAALGVLQTAHTEFLRTEPSACIYIPIQSNNTTGERVRKKKHVCG